MIIYAPSLGAPSCMRDHINQCAETPDGVLGILECLPDRSGKWRSRAAGSDFQRITSRGTGMSSEPDQQDADPAVSGSQAVDLQTDRPHPARVYDYLLGGQNNFAASRSHCC